MQVVNKKMCVIVILVLVIIESCTLFLMYKSYGNKNNTLDEVNLNISNSNMFAIMLEQDDGTYKEDTTSTWPTSGYTYNESMSGCIDLNGNKLDNALTYDKENNKASVNTTNTSYCYLYFSIKKTIGSYILKNPTTGLTATSLQGGMYRYQDSVADNYICFGTSDKDECTIDTGIYMYRIIGIKESGQLYLLKKEALDEVYAWHENDSELVSWPESDLFKRLNGTYRNSNGELEPAFVGNSKYPYMIEGNSWYDKIELHNWKYGKNFSNYQYYSPIDGIFYDEPDPTLSYKYEIEFTDSINAKISLMSTSDYLYKFYSDDPRISEYFGDWGDINSNDLEIPSNGLYNYYGWNAEWGSSYFFDPEFGLFVDMTDLSWSKNGYMQISTDFFNEATFGDEQYYVEKVELPVRPVFYLNNDIQYVSGNGTLDDPFIIN